MFKAYKQLLFLSLVLIAAVLLSNIYAKQRIGEGMAENTKESLETVLGSSHQALLTWSRHERSSVSTWANNSRVREITRELLALPQSKTVLVATPLQAELREELKPVIRSRRYQGYFIVSPDGTNLASTRNQNIGQPNLLIDQPGFLDKLFEGEVAISLPQRSDVPLRDENGKLVKGLPTMFAGSPIFSEEGGVLAVFVFRLNPRKDFSNIFQRARIGEGGETYAFSREGRLISNSRFDEQLYRLGLLRPGEFSMLNIWLRDPGGDLSKSEVSTDRSEQWPLTRMARDGTQGRAGYDIEGYNDYRGVKVVGTWLWDDELNFGIATELDWDESYKTTGFILTIVDALTVVAILLLSLLSLYFVNSQRWIKESRERLAGVIEMSDEAIISINEEQTIILANEAAEKTFGYGAGEMEGQSLDILIPEPYREIHRQHVQNFAISDKQMLSRDVRGHVEGLRKNGEIFPMEATVAKQSISGHIMMTVSARDITERKRVEEALRNSEDMFRKAFEASEDAILILDGDTFVDCNDATIRMLRAPNREAVLSTHPWELSPEYQPDGQLSSTKAAEMIRLAHEKHFHRFEWMHRRMDGVDFPVEVTLTTAQMGDRKYLHVSWNDITERKYAEVQLRENEARLRMLTDYANDMISTHDADGVYRFVSPACRRLLGYCEDELLGHSAYEFIHPDDLEQIRQNHDTILQKENPRVVTYRILHKDGHYIWFETTNNSVLDEESGEVLEIVAVSRDVSNRVEAEAALRKERDRAQSYLDTVEAFMVALDREGHITMLNRKACEVLGYRELELLGKDWFEICLPQPEGLETIKPVFYQIMQGDMDGSEYYENPIITRSGQQRYIAWHNTILHDNHGEIAGALSAGQDITELKQVQDKEEQLQRQLLHSQKMEALGRLTGGIAHDFNNILASAKGYTELALMRAEEVNDEKQQHYLSEVYKSADRAAAVVKQMLAFARGSKSEPSHYLLQEVVEEALTMMRPLLTASIEIKTVLDPNTYPVLIDNVQFNQVLLNLCINARDAMEGEGVIEIGVRTVNAQGECSSCHELIDCECVELYVKDSGPGIAPEQLSRIFDPFFTSKEVGKGSGMGLSVVHGIVHDHHGHIQVESHAGLGTTFHIYLPIA